MNYKTKCITQNMFVSFSKCNSKTSAFIQHLILKKNADKHLKNVQKKTKHEMADQTKKKYILIMHSTHKSIIKSAHNKICVHPSQSETIHSNTSTKTAKNINFH